MTLVRVGRVTLVRVGRVTLVRVGRVTLVRVGRVIQDGKDEGNYVLYIVSETSP